ncbi:hypothetical protein Dsin_031264 [Dipteronia sinensis]|uniref:Uncharacterized protein n=1 Tax=Dipteronia sinensis TaxID=43782 RepID=A0AAE0DS13_9ROSI|nr:hypothetical protein Dsin_031264 [Dipteronia sinensis]
MEKLEPQTSTKQILPPAKQIVDEASISNEADCREKPSSQTEMEERGRSSREEEQTSKKKFGYGVDGDLMIKYCLGEWVMKMKFVNFFFLFVCVYLNEVLVVLWMNCSGFCSWN